MIAAPASGRVENLLLRLPAVGDNAAMQTELPKADLPKRKCRRFQFRLRTLVFWIIPYVAIYAAVVSLIFSGDDAQRPVGTPGDALYSLRMISGQVGEVMGPKKGTFYFS